MRWRQNQIKLWHAACALVILIAFALRFTALTEVPHSLFNDEAWFEVRAREVLQGRNLLPVADPVFRSGNSPLTIYATALVQALGAPAAYSARWVSAAAGVLGVAFMLPCVLGLLRAWPGPGSPRVAALAAAAVSATLMVGVMYSRDGRQNPLCAAVTILFVTALHRAFERRSLRWAVGAGALLALAQTTYEAALALPLLAAAYTLARIALPPRMAALAAARLGGAVLLAGLLFYAPLLVYYTQHPEVALERVWATYALRTEGGWWAMAGEALAGYGRVWLGLGVQGDAAATQNLPGRPLLDPFVLALFVIGLAAAVVEARRSAGVQLLLLWAAVLALPPAVTANPPAFSRLLPATPAVAGVAGLGTARLAAAAARRFGRAGRWAAAAVLAAGFAYSAAVTVRDYAAWNRDPRVRDALHVYGRDTLERALAWAQAGDVFVTPRSHPLVTYSFALTLDEHPAVTAFDAAPGGARPACLPYAHQLPRPVTYGVIQVMDALTLPALKAGYPTGREVDWVMHHDGYAYAVFFQVPPHTPASAPAHAASAAFENGLALAGFDAASGLRPGQPFTLTLYWQAARPAAGVETDVNVFVHVGQGAASDPLIAQADGAVCPGLPPSRWKPGYVYASTHTLTVDAAAPAGVYDIRVGLWVPDELVRVPVVAADREVENARVVLGEVEVAPR